jgi:hypothetical protein
MPTGERLKKAFMQDEAFHKRTWRANDIVRVATSSVKALVVGVSNKVQNKKRNEGQRDRGGGAEKSGKYHQRGFTDKHARTVKTNWILYCDVSFLLDMLQPGLLQSL